MYLIKKWWYAGREGMWHYSENKCYLLASRQSLQSGTWKDWMSISQCAADLSCLSALHDEAQPLNALPGFMCLCVLCCGIVLLLLLLVCCVYFMAFYQWMRYLTGCVFYHYWCSLWSICLGWVDFSGRNYTFYNLYPICSWLGLTEFWDFFLCAWHFSFFFGDSSQCGETGNIMRQRQKSKRRRRRAFSEVLGWRQTQDVILHPLRHRDALWVKKKNTTPTPLWKSDHGLFQMSSRSDIAHLTLKEAPHD